MNAMRKPLQLILSTAATVLLAMSFACTEESEKGAMQVHPYKTALITRWGQEVTPENAWTEYPRPQMAREQWQHLNGLWDYAITQDDAAAAPDVWAGNILVPFCLESRLGGVQRLLQPEEALWYRRSFEVADITGKRTLLNFEAVDYRCEVWVNGTSVGSHQGGNTPFSLDITNAVQQGGNELIVRVEDETGGWQLRGKQVLENKGIWYTRVSGIWQTVWLEQVSAAYIEDLTLKTDAASGTVNVAAEVNGSGDGAVLRVTMKDGETVVASAEGSVSGLALQVASPKLWTPDTPHLYALDIELLDGAGASLDRVSSYAGIRTVGKTRDAEGHLRFTLNGETIFQWGPLDQGWWPDGLLTPPSDAA
ncbi:MAG TPA: glycoside hydrolase family 2, partial [Candidatus Hydrogenedentes bacterium]|nr:glycoside hydrolase family 2 [Candidatus Hydrogenedentota bacterium]